MFKFPRNFDELLNAKFTKKCLIKQGNLYSNLSLFCFLVTRIIITCQSFEIMARPRLLVWKFQSSVKIGIRSVLPLFCAARVPLSRVDPRMKVAQIKVRKFILNFLSSCHLTINTITQSEHQYKAMFPKLI